MTAIWGSLRPGGAAPPGPVPRRPSLGFPARFLLAMAVVALVWTVFEPSSTLWRDGTAAVVAWIARLAGLHPVIGPDAQMSFSLTDGRSFRYVVADACTATVVLATYGAAVIAYPTSRRTRLLGLAIGVPMLIGLNVVRLVTLAWVGLHAPQSFEAVHLYWWQTFYVVGVGLIWFAWMWYFAGARAFVAGSGADAGSGSGAGAGRRWATTTLPVVAAVLGAFAVVGLWGHGAELYLRAMLVPARLLYRVLWGGAVPAPALSDQAVYSAFAGYYALLAAVLALFLASPGIDWRQRVRAAVTRGLPLTFALQLATAIATTTIQVRAGAGGGGAAGSRATAFLAPLMLALHVGLSLIAWHLWFQRARRAEAARLERSARRRRRANHPRSHR